MSNLQPKQAGVDTQNDIRLDVPAGVAVQVSVNAYQRSGARYQFDVIQKIPTPIVSRYLGNDDLNDSIDFVAMPIPWQLEFSLANSGTKIPAYITTRPVTTSLPPGSSITWEFNSNYGGAGMSIRGGEVTVKLLASHPRIATGKTDPDDWQDYDNPTNNAYGIYVDVDTSAAGFSSVPNYHVSLHGQSTHWKVSGVNSIYDESKKGFRIYLCWSDNEGPFEPNNINPLRAAYAKKNGWFLRWTAVERGQD